MEAMLSSTNDNLDRHGFGSSVQAAEESKTAGVGSFPRMGRSIPRDRESPLRRQLQHGGSQSGSMYPEDTH